MSITIEINSKQLNDERNKLNLHYLPAKISGDGEANVEKYFNVYTRKEHGYLTNTLRGFPLQGEIQSIPSSHKGVVLQETRKPLDETADRILRITGTFEEFTYWNYDKIPSASDGYKLAMQLSDIAGVLSEPISEAEVLKEMEQKNNESKNK